MRAPRVKNIYDLTIEKMYMLKVKNRALVKEPLFWRNSAISAWCISAIAGDSEFGDENAYWIGIFDDNASEDAGKFVFRLSTYGGMCGYQFNEFFREEDIENDWDLEIQEKFLNKVNQLIYMGILGF